MNKNKGNADKFTWTADDIEWEDEETPGSTAPKPATGQGEPSKGWLGKLDQKIKKDIGNNG